MFSFDMEKMFQNVPRRSYNISDVLWLSVKKMNIRIITFTLILTLLLSPTAQTLRAQETEPVIEDETNDPAILNMIRTQTMERKQDVLNILGPGPYSSDVENSLQHAEQAMTQALNLEDSNPQAAAEQYLRSMKHYRNAYRKFVEEEDISGDEASAEVTAADDVETVTDEEVEAAKIQLLNRFQERFREQIQQMMQNVDDMEDELSPQDGVKARQAFTHALEKMIRIRERIESGEYDEAVDELDEATESLEDELEAVEDPNTAQMLKALNGLEARIQKMVQSVARKAALGEDVSDIGSMLEELRGNKDGLKGDFKMSKGKGGEQGSQGGNGKGNN